MTIPEGKNRYDIATIFADKTKLATRTQFLQGSVGYNPSVMDDRDVIA